MGGLACAGAGFEGAAGVLGAAVCLYGVLALSYAASRGSAGVAGRGPGGSNGCNGCNGEPAASPARKVGCFPRRAPARVRLRRERGVEHELTDTNAS